LISKSLTLFLSRQERTTNAEEEEERFFIARGGRHRKGTCVISFTTAAVMVDERGSEEAEGWPGKTTRTKKGGVGGTDVDLLQ